MGASQSDATSLRSFSVVSIAPKKMPVARPVLVKALHGALGAPQKHSLATPNVQAFQLYDPSVVDTLATMKMPPPAAESSSGKLGKLAQSAQKPPPGPRNAEEVERVLR